MKLVTFVPGSDPSGILRVGAVIGEEPLFADLQAGSVLMSGKPASFLSDMIALLDGGEEALDYTAGVIDFVSQRRPEGTVYRMEDIFLKAPVPQPRSIRDCLVFKKHLIQATRTMVKWRFKPLAYLDAWMERTLGAGLIKPSRAWLERPLYYKGNPHTVVGPESDIQWPEYTGKLDYELEFGIFIGRRGKDIPREKAGEYIAGYTIFNDFSARDTQVPEMMGRLGPAKSKDFDTGNAMGPFLVTADEVADPYNLTMVARVNGEEWSRGNSRDMFHRFEDIISYISRDETLYPGEFIGSGTVGNGCGLEFDRWLKPGDVVELEVEGLGILRNRVVRPPKGNCYPT
ncbi:MAG: fumarylacetoacetate hydrolase family protein [Bacillota bacterium]